MQIKQKEMKINLKINWFRNCQYNYACRSSSLFPSIAWIHRPRVDYQI